MSTDLIPAGDRLDRYRDHLFSGTKLRKKEQEQLQKFRKAFGWLSGGYSHRKVVHGLIREYEVSESQAYRIVQDAVALYGALASLDKEGLRQIMVENFMRIHRKAVAAEDFMNANRALENVTKLQRLLDEDGGVDPKTFLIPVPISFTTNPAALKKQMTNDFEGGEYVEFEETE